MDCAQRVCLVSYITVSFVIFELELSENFEVFESNDGSRP